MQNRFTVSLSSCAILLWCSTGSVVHAVDRAELKFIPAGWKVECDAQGDLTGHKTRDVAIITGLNAGGGFGHADERKVIILLRGADGKLQKSVEAGKCLPLGAGPSGGDPTISIEDHAVVLNQFGGSREKGDTTYRYKLINGQWRLAGYRGSYYDSLGAGIPQSTTDVNFITGRLRADLKVDGNVAQHTDFIELYAYRGKPPASGDWKVPSTVLDKVELLSQGARRWNGATDLSVRVYGMHDENKLYIQAAVTDDVVTPEDSVALLDTAGKPIEPEMRKHVLAEHGYSEFLQYDLHKPVFSDMTYAMGESGKEAVFLPVRLEVVDSDGGGRAKKGVLSPAISSGGTKIRAGILLCPWSGLPKIQDVDVQDGSVHNIILDFPPDSPSGT